MDWKTLFDKGPVAVIRWKNRPGLPVEDASTNLPELTGYTAEQMASDEFLFARLIEREAPAGEEPGALFAEKTWKLRRRDGQLCWLRHHVSPEPSPGALGGEVTHYVGYVIDVSEWLSKELAKPTTLQPPRQRTILVADDQPLIRKTLGIILNELGYRMIEAQDGPEAIALFQRHRRDIDLALLDLTMPGMSGAATMRALRKLQPGLPVLLSSGHSEDQLRSLQVTEPVAYLQKPYSFDDLERVLSKLLPG